MQSTRRNFIKSSLAVSATAALTTGIDSRAAQATPPVVARDYYELRAYRLKPDTSSAVLEKYLEKALIPGLNARGLGNIGVFTEVEVDKKSVTAKPKIGTTTAPVAIWVLITHPSLESFTQISTELNSDVQVQAAAPEYFQTPKSNPAYERVDTWLLQAFAGMPKLAVPAFSKNKTPTRIFELRDYESHSEERALSKMAMFNDGEIPLMQDLGMSPVFFGQALAGPNLPHLRYITCGPDLATHLGNWKKFGPDPRWVKMKDQPSYKDNTSKNTARFIVPTAYSQI